MTAVRYRVRCLLRADWVSAVGLAVVVALIGGLVLTLVAGAHRTATVSDRYSDSRGDRWDTAMEQSDGPPLTEDVEALPAVDDVASATFLFGGILGADGAPIESIISFVGEAEAFGAELTDGRLPDPANPHEFAASPDFLSLTGAQLGDQFTFISISAETAAEVGFDAEQPDGPTFDDATLVGVVESPSADLQDSFTLTVFPLTLLDEGSIGLAATESLVALHDGASVSDLRQQLDTLSVAQPDGSTVDGSNLTLDPAEWVDRDVRRAVSAAAIALWVIAGIVAFAGALVVGQVAIRQARLSDDQRLSLSSMGLTRGQLLADGLARIGIPATVGVLGAVGLAYAVSGAFPRGFVEPLEPDPGLRFDPLVLGIGALLLLAGLLSAVAVTLALGRRGERRRRPVSFVESLVPKVGRLRPAMGLRFAFARHPRDAGGISTPAVGLFAILVVLVGAATYGQSLDTLLDDQNRWGQTFDDAIGQGGGEVPAEAAEAVAANPEVASVTLLGTIRVNVGDAALDVTGARSVSGDLGARVLDGRVASTSDEIALGTLSADDLGVGIGDQLTVESTTGEHTFDVVGLVVMPGVEGSDGLGRGGLVTEEAFRALDDEAALSAAAVDFVPGADLHAAETRLSEQLGIQIGAQDSPSVIINLDRVRHSPYYVVGILFFLALVSLGNLIAAALRHRRKEIAVLRSVGADRRWVGGVVHWHTIAFTLVVAGLAVPFGIVVGRLTYVLTIAEQLGVADDTFIPVLRLGLALLVLLVLAEIVGQVTVRRQRGSVARTLAAE